MTPDYGPYQVHPLADAFPLLEGEEFDLLVASIADFGLSHSIQLSADLSTIIDGRNRYLACIAAHVDPHFEPIPETWSEETIAKYIWAENTVRRQLTPSQRAMVGLRFREHFVERARQRQGSRGVAKPHGQYTSVPRPAEEASTEPLKQEAAAQAAAITGASRDGIYRAAAVEKADPELAKQVEAGQTSLKSAYTQVKEQEKARPKPEPAPKPSPVMLSLPSVVRKGETQQVPYPKPQGKATFNSSSGPGISWADWSWNPVTGCLHGCDYCYARELATSERYKATYPVGFTPLFHHERLDAPINTPVPAGASGTAKERVFVCSMADLYGEWVPQEWIEQVHAAELGNPQWQYLHLTKFPRRYTRLDLPSTGWIGTSVDTQRRVRAAEEAFAEIDGVAVKWLSIEPLLEELHFNDLSAFDWVVIGAQTETRQPDKVVPAFAPPIQWVARLIDQAHEAGCLVHCKPNLMGSVSPNSPGMRLPDEFPSPKSGGSNE